MKVKITFANNAQIDYLMEYTDLLQFYITDLLSRKYIICDGRFYNTQSIVSIEKSLDKVG